jgi:hypothetical protein
MPCQRATYFDRNGRELSEDEALDHNGIIRDGVTARTSLMMRDGINPALTALQRSVASRHQLSDQEVASCRPGFRYPRSGSRAAADRQALVRLYDALDAELSQAYRTPPSFGSDPRITGAGSHGAIGQREGDVCTVRGPEFAASFGQPGHLRMHHGKLVCVPDNVRDISHSRSDAKARRRSRIDDPDEDEDDDDDGDDRTVAQASADHQARMQLIYDELDSELREKWRTP